MTSLHDILLRRIRSEGPLTVADYMATCLFHPDHGYYSTRHPIGAAGDFVTAPEISQMFGELLGLALAQTWIDQGRPSSFVLVELGPGRGTLMADLQRATARVPGFHASAELHLVEASPSLRAEQARALDIQPTWHETVHTLPDGPLYCIANEFFDALAIRQFLRAPAGWSERLISAQEDALSFALTKPAPLGALAHRLEDTKEGTLIETCAPARAISGVLADRIERHGGVAYILDYGDWRSQGDTLQAVRGHAPVDPLDGPGTADLTAHVDFEALTADLPCAHTRLTPQGVFLERLGITARAQALADAGDAGAVAAHRRLTHPEEMGNLFKAVALYPQAAPPPPGFAP